MKEQLISAAINIGGGLVAALIYDLLRGRLRPAPAPSAPANYENAGAPGASRTPPPAGMARPAAGASGGGGLASALLVLVLMIAVGIAGTFVAHRMGFGALRPGLDTILRQGATIGVSMAVFVWLLSLLHRRA